MDGQREWELSDWKRLGEAFAAARKATGLSQVEAGGRLEVTRTPIQAIERGVQSNGKPFTRVTGTMRAYARLVGWTEGSPARILDGQGPEPASQPVSPSGEPPLPDLPPAVARELRTGRTLDHVVVDLGTDERHDTRVIVVFQGSEDMSEEELDKAWEAWRRTRRMVQSPQPPASDSPEA